jgi:putative endonuclease
MDNKKKGAAGEDIAARYLVEKGYTILERNYIYYHKEIDIIAENDEFIVIVEVKSRSSDYFENPEDAVSKKKIRMLVDAAEGYLFSRGIVKDVRFDVIAILFNPGRPYKIEHFEDAFLPPIW